MGVVYEAEDTTLGRRVALKFLPRDVAHSSTSLEWFLGGEDRFCSESENICVIFEMSEFEGQPFIAMELLEAESLAERMLSRPLTNDQLDIGTQVADALDAAHHDEGPALKRVSTAGGPPEGVSSASEEGVRFLPTASAWRFSIVGRNTKPWP